MHTRIAGAVALLATGLLAGAFLYGRAIVVPTFASAPLDVHLAFRVELMKMNAGVMQSLMGSAVVASAWLGCTLGGRARVVSAGASALAVSALLVTRFGSVPINLEIKRWAAVGRPPDYPARLHTWDVFNDVRTTAALGAFLAVVVATDFARVRIPPTSSDQETRTDATSSCALTRGGGE